MLVRGELDAAVRHLRSTVEVCERAGGMHALAGFALLNLARACQRQQSPELAETTLAEAEARLRLAGARGLQLEADLQRARLDLDTGRTAEALTRAERAYELSRGGATQDDLAAEIVESLGLFV